MLRSLLVLHTCPPEGHRDDVTGSARDIHVALQMTNIFRDVVRTVTPRWRQLMRFQIDRARKLYDESWQGLSYLERDGQLAIGAAAIFYRGILDQIEKNDYDVFTKRASLSAWKKLSRIPSLWMKVKAL